MGVCVRRSDNCRGVLIADGEPPAFGDPKRQQEQQLREISQNIKTTETSSPRGPRGKVGCWWGLHGLDLQFLYDQIRVLGMFEAKFKVGARIRGPCAIVLDDALSCCRGYCSQRVDLVSNSIVMGRTYQLVSTWRPGSKVL